MVVPARQQPPALRLLSIEEHAADAWAVRQLASAAPLDAALVRRAGAEAGLGELARAGADCVLLGYRPPAGRGLATLRELRGRGLDAAVVVVTGAGDEGAAVEALRAGAQDYLPTASASPEAFARAVRNAVERVALDRRLARERAALHDFVGVVAHDLQQPLCSVRGNMELIRDFYAERLDDAGREFVAAALRSSARMSERIEALLGYARVGRERAPVERLDLHEVLAGVLADLSDCLARAEAAVRCRPLPAASGDPATIAQLLQNLIANAVKFGGDRPPEIEIGGLERESDVLVWVRDHGVGIPAGSLEEIFEPFRRLPSAKATPGSGIGLATCKRIAEQHGGRIWAERAPGGGAVFFVLLPRASSSPNATGRLSMDGRSGNIVVLASPRESLTRS